LQRYASQTRCFYFWGKALIWLTLAVVLGYLIGSIPFGYLIVRLRLGADIRESGSGGTGATNVSRRAGKAAGLVTLLLDAAKGVAAVLAAKFVAHQTIINPEWVVSAAAVAALLGHIFPIWLRFRGGKGVATGAGAMAVVAPVPAMIAAGAFLLTVLLTRYVSLGSIVAAATLPIAVVISSAIAGRSIDVATFALGITGAVLIIWAHRANIARLRTGDESRFR
jgi:glycerol-3-phosphate acyltransferase PlsY